MKLVLKTRRLILREFIEDDAEFCFYLNSDPEVLKFTGDEPFESVEESSDFLKNYSDYERNGFGRWAVIPRSSNQPIGWCGLKKNTEGYVDIGFRFLKSEWGRGYATESARACLEFGFDHFELDEIIGRAAQENFASIRVLQKLGLEYWKKEASDGIQDLHIYRIKRDAFLNHLD